MNSKRKGKLGELEWAAYCAAFGFNTRRGVQYAGGPDSPDVIGLDGVHIEVKRSEHLNIHEAMKQSIRDCQEKAIPIVAHRRNREGWLVTMRAEEWMEIYKGWLKANSIG